MIQRCHFSPKKPPSGLIHFDSLGFIQERPQASDSRKTMPVLRQVSSGSSFPVSGLRFRKTGLIRLDSLASASPGPTETGCSIRSRPASGSRQNAPKYGRIALIRFDSLGSARPRPDRSRLQHLPVPGERQAPKRRKIRSDRFDSLGFAVISHHQRMDSGMPLPTKFYLVHLLPPSALLAALARDAFAPRSKTPPNWFDRFDSLGSARPRPDRSRLQHPPVPGERQAPKRSEIWSDYFDRFDSLGFTRIASASDPFRSPPILGALRSQQFYFDSV
jgi:hypothetical protein